MITAQRIVEQTAKWIRQVIIKNNFCPFAAAEVAKNSIHYQVSESQQLKVVLQEIATECQRLDEDPSIATTLLIFPTFFDDFYTYLDLVHQAEDLLVQMDYEGIYQLATFHPEYRFADALTNDPANYTNRSPYPMVHILREVQLEKALQTFLHPERIPERNIALARKLGLEKMKADRNDCFKNEDL